MIAWIGTSSVWIMFFWSILTLFDIIFYILGLYFFYVFVDNKDISLRLKLIFAVILSPFLILMPTAINLPGFDYTYCYAVDTSFLGYVFYAKILIASWLAILAVYKYSKAKSSEDRLRIIILSLGLGLFLFSFFITGYIADTYLRYDVELYGLYFMTIFMGILAYLIVRFKAFNIKLLGVQALIYALIILIGSQFFFIQAPINLILTGITLLLSIVFGGFLILSVQKEVKQREEIERLADSLAKSNDHLYIANEKLKELDRQKTEFVSIASHQLRSPLTAIKGYSSMLLEGSFGPVEDKARGAIDRIFESSQKLVNVIEDFLNITRIELGRMKYEVSVFDLGKLAETVITDQKPNVEKKGLTISLESGSDDYQISADSGKVTQVLSNLIDNSIKYTPARTGGQSGPAGWIKIKLENAPASNKLTSGKSSKKEVVRLTIADSGVGIEPATLEKLFNKFVRADDAGKTNITGT
ncbi:MAG TPA: HAMP domain-containing sensor histidine kinase, partial [Candidatus Paceibacterota bacterium]|nr:HAMP domain-containing sensor histidine kinase [Candidatus Paceibacterota bacterium]